MGVERERKNCVLTLAAKTLVEPLLAEPTEVIANENYPYLLCIWEPCLLDCSSWNLPSIEISGEIQRSGQPSHSHDGPRTSCVVKIKS